MSIATIRPFTTSDLDAVFSLYETVFGAEALDRFRRRWQWEFFDNPNTDTLPSRLEVADIAGRIVGFMAAFPVRQKVFDQELVVRRSCDLMVSPLVREDDPTIAIRLLLSMKDGPGDTLWVGMGYTPKHREMRRRLGHRYVDAIPFYIRPLDLRSMLRFRIGTNGAAPRWAAPPVSWIMDGSCALANVALAGVNLVRRPPRSASVASIEPLSRAGREIDELWRRVSVEFPIIGVRDSRFVQWRFFDDPVFEHTVLLARSADGTPLGYLAMRVGSKGPMKLGRILDIFCSPGSDTAVALLRHALDLFQRERVGAVSCLGLHPALRKQVRKYLYFSPASRQHDASLMWKGDPRLRDGVYDAGNWHLSHADGDEGFAP